MSLLHLRIAGYELDDGFVLKLLIGIACGLILLVLIGTSGFSDWVLESLVVWMGVTLIVIPITFIFLEEHVEGKHLIMVTLGAVLLVIFSITTNHSFTAILISVLEVLIWMSLFSIVLDSLKDRIKNRAWTKRKRR